MGEEITTKWIFSSADGDFPAYGIFSVKRVFPSSLLGNNFEFRRWDAFRGGQPGMEREGEINKTPRAISRDRFMGDTCVQCEMAGDC